jgi:hypothetical protein
VNVVINKDCDQVNFEFKNLNIDAEVMRNVIESSVHPKKENYFLFLHRRKNFGKLFLMEK